VQPRYSKWIKPSLGDDAGALRLDLRLPHPQVSRPLGDQLAFGYEYSRWHLGPQPFGARKHSVMS
jgi:hypothetical protein